MAAWAVFLAVVAGRAELFAVAVPLLVALLGPPKSCPGWRLTRSVSATRLYEHECLTVTVTLVAGGALPLAEVRDPLAPGVGLASGKPCRVFSLRAGGRVRWQYRLRAGARGRYRLEPLQVYVYDAFGLRLEQADAGSAVDLRIYPSPVGLRRLPQPSATRSSFGNYASASRGAGIEPAEVRPFTPGDVLRRVNWRASLRRGKLHVTDFHAERNADVVVLLDTLADIGARPGSSLDLCTRAAAAAATAYLRRRDRVALLLYGGYVNWVSPGQGPLQRERLLEALIASEVRFSYSSGELYLLPPRILSPQALVLGFTALLDERFPKATINLAARGYDVLVLALSPITLLRATLRPTRLDDLACRLWTLEWRARLAELRARGVQAVEWQADEPLETVLARCGRRALPRIRRG